MKATPLVIGGLLLLGTAGPLPAIRSTPPSNPLIEVVGLSSQEARTMSVQDWSLDVSLQAGQAQVHQVLQLRSAVTHAFVLASPASGKWLINGQPSDSPLRAVVKQGGVLRIDYQGSIATRFVSQGPPHVRRAWDFAVRFPARWLGPAARRPLPHGHVTVESAYTVAPSAPGGWEFTGHRASVDLAQRPFTPAEFLTPVFDGRLEAIGMSTDMQGTHQLLDGAGTPVATLQADPAMALEKYVGQQVEVAGKTSRTVESGRALVQVEAILSDKP